MANKIYPKTYERGMQGGLDLLNANVKALLVDLGQYTYSDAHEFLSDVPSGARVASSPNLASKSIATVNTDDVRFDAADPTITVGASQPTVEAVIFYIDTGAAGTSRLLCFKDTGVTGLPYTPPSGGGDVLLQLSASGIMEWRN
jgi:hypothetical protein